MLITIAVLLIGVPIAIIIKALRIILLAFLLMVALIRIVGRFMSWLVVALYPWRHPKGHVVVASGLFGAALVILVTASLVDSLYLSHGWLSSGLDIITAFAAFLMGMILERGIDPKTLSLGNWGKLILKLIIVLGITFSLVHWFQPDPIWHKLPIFIAAFVLPILGILGKLLWSRIFKTAAIGLQDEMPQTRTESAQDARFED